MGHGERVALVTGAAQGIGRAYATALAEAGYPIVLADVDASVATTAAELEATGARALGVQLDVSSVESIDAAWRVVEERFGAPLVLVNNAALFASLALARWDEITAARWDEVMAVNLRGPFLTAQRALRGMVEAGWGRVVNIASTTVMTGGIGRTDYVASKAGVIGMTRALAREVGQTGVTVNAISPGGTQSPGVLQTYSEERLAGAIASRSIRRAQVPEDLVGALLFLVSDAAEFVTGQTLVVDGGHVFL